MRDIFKVAGERPTTPREDRFANVHTLVKMYEMLVQFAVTEARLVYDTTVRHTSRNVWHACAGHTSGSVWHACAGHTPRGVWCTCAEHTSRTGWHACAGHTSGSVWHACAGHTPRGVWCACAGHTSRNGWHDMIPDGNPQRTHPEPPFGIPAERNMANRPMIAWYFQANLPRTSVRSGWIHQP